MSEQYTPRFAERKGCFREGRLAAPRDPRAADVPTKGEDSAWKEDPSGELVRSPLLFPEMRLRSIYLQMLHIFCRFIYSAS